LYNIILNIVINVNYLIMTESPVTYIKQSLKAYKSNDAYKYNFYFVSLIYVSVGFLSRL